MDNSKESLNLTQSTYLDFVRGCAALLVLFGHASLLFLNNSSFSKMDIQVIGVLVFFLMSGFLISYSVFRKFGDPLYGFKHFFIDRFCRIYCAFIPALFFVLLMDNLTLALPQASPANLEKMPWHIPTILERVDVKTWLGNLFMLQDFPIFQIAMRLDLIDAGFFIKSFGSASPFWTISIEWWIYMLFGLITICLIRDKKRVTIPILVLLGLTSIVPVYYLMGGPDNCLSFMWIIGMLASLLFVKYIFKIERKYLNISNHKWRMLYFSIFLISLFLMAGRAMAIKFDRGTLILAELQFGVFLSIGVFSLLFLFGKFTIPYKALHKTFGFIANYSYSLYLTHAPFITYLYIRYPGHDNDTAFFWMAIILSNILAISFWWLFERHHRKISAWIKLRTNNSSSV